MEKIYYCSNAQKYYRPIFLLPILGKVFEKILYNNIFEYLQESTMLCKSQSGFRRSDTCEYLLVSIVYETDASFNCNPPFDVRAVFLDISKAFNRVWHNELVYKMKLLGMTESPLKLTQNVLNNKD